MQSKGTWAARMWFGVLALIGMVAGHQASFFLAERSDAHPHSLWELTGHGSWASVHAVAAALGLAILVGFIGASIRTSLAGKPRHAGYSLALRWLAPLQLAAFLGVEVVERLSLGASAIEILTDRVILIGLFVQVVVAALACLALLVIARVVERLVRATLTTPTAASRRSFSLPRCDSRPLDLARVAWSLRGPPLTSM